LFAKKERIYKEKRKNSLKEHTFIFLESVITLKLYFKINIIKF